MHTMSNTVQNSCMRNRRILGIILFVLYIGFLLWFLIASDWYGRSGVMEDYHYNLTPFQEIKRFWQYREQLGLTSVLNLLGNVLIFLPYGFFEAMASRNESFWGTLLDGLSLSLLVEIFQFATKVGCFDVDDIILNTAGVIIGYLLYLLNEAKRRKHGAKRERTR